MKKYKFITSKPDIMGGTPCIAGTRVPIDVIISLLKQGYAIKEIDKMYPWVGMDRLLGALDELSNLTHNLENGKNAQTVLQA